ASAGNPIATDRTSSTTALASPRCSTTSPGVTVILAPLVEPSYWTAAIAVDDADAHLTAPLDVGGGPPHRQSEREHEVIVALARTECFVARRRSPQQLEVL